jgi:hypothetical protein
VKLSRRAVSVVHSLISPRVAAYPYALGGRQIACSYFSPMKNYVTRNELLRIINSDIANDPSCEDCEVNGALYHLRIPEYDGTNWSDSLIVRGHGRDPRPCFSVAVPAAVRAREQYALRTDSGWLMISLFCFCGRASFYGYRRSTRG